MLHRNLNMICFDCKVDTEKINEFYMVHDHLWKQAVTNQNQRENRVLCIGCLETRLGRTLTADDFIDFPINKKGVQSYRLISRINNIEVKEKDLLFQLKNSNYCIKVCRYNKQELLLLQLLTESLTAHQVVKKSKGEINKCSFYNIIERWIKLRIIKTETVSVRVLNYTFSRTFYSRNFKNPLPTEVK